MKFEELDNQTREHMLREFQEEQRGRPYESPEMTTLGKAEFPHLMEKAIKEGNEVTLSLDLSKIGFWLPEGRRRDGISYKINPTYAAERLALTEFNTWYVRGLAKKLMDEGVEYCEVYRADSAKEPRPECLDHDGKKFKVADIYNGHRSRYHPPPGNPKALSIPVGPNCHHTIRRLKS